MAERGSEFEGEVRDLASDGRGVLRHPSGRTIFVPGVWPGERVRVRVTQVRGRVGSGVCLQRLAASPERIEPPCPNHGHSDRHCGGCPWQFAAYEAQLAAKQQRVHQTFARLDAAGSVAPIWPSPEQYGYRNRAQLKTDGERLGFVAAASNQLVDVDHCAVLSPHNAQLLSQLRATLPNADWRPARRQQWTTLDIDEDCTPDEVGINQRRPFQQANSAQNSAMRQWLEARLAPLDKQLPVLELFCGNGNFTEVIARSGFTRITAAEGVEATLAALAARQLPGVTPVLANLYAEGAGDALLRKAGKPGILVLDPPRDGLKQAAPYLAARTLQQVFYISCDLATLARDVAGLQQVGFEVAEVQPLDQFPHTPHIESLVWLRRRA